MIPALIISPKDWMLFPECQTVMQVLNNDPEKPQAFFVGGCVRNLLLGKDVKDLDIATLHAPEVVQKKCLAAGLKTIPTGIEHGTVTVLVGEKSFEVTTLRRDVSTDGRRATVEFSADWLEDARRRDFTMNTLLLDLNGHVYDPTGRGLEDLQVGQVIFVGNPMERIQEDYLRILRFFRFHAYFGKGAPDEAALKACATFSDNIPKLSRERISQEFFLILMAKDAIKSLGLMRENNVLTSVMPQDFSFLSRLVRAQKNYQKEHLEARLFCLLGCSLSKLESVSKTTFIFSNKQKQFFKELSKLFEKAEKMRGVDEVAYRVSLDVAAQYFLMVYEGKELEEAMVLLTNWKQPLFPLNGHDAKALGIEPGRSMRGYLERVEDWWIEQGFKPDKAACRAYLQSLIR
jgi:poly(A) polymerase